ncbi:MAG: cysteine synthase A [Spirochaetales bacterium]|nr:cysteine synthase A [Spirochaetales bacterium]
MAGIYRNVAELIGNTPLVELANIERELSLSSKLYAKLEYFNPAGSIKDRAALSMIEDAEAKGLLKKGSVIIEPTSGNTGIALAAVATTRGYDAIIVMPDSMSKERISMMKGYGAKVVLTPGSLGMKGAIEKAEELKNSYENAFIPAQFDNPANAEAHYKTTGPEIYRDLEGNVDILVASVGTGGTISGLGRYLKEKNPEIKVVAVEPEASPLLSKGYAASHKIQGIGANFVPSILNLGVIDQIVTVSDREAFDFSKLVGRREGISVGISSGAALAAAVRVAKENEGKNIVVIFPDGGSRYLSTALFED